jgi:hypothetical protein
MPVLRVWFETFTLIKGKKKRDYWLTWMSDRPVEDGPTVVAPSYIDQIELGARVARMIDK